MLTCEKIVEYLVGVGVKDASSTTQLAQVLHQPAEPYPERTSYEPLEVMHLIAWVEETFSVEIPIDDIVPDNFATPQTLAAYIDKLTTK